MKFILLLALLPTLTQAAEDCTAAAPTALLDKAFYPKHEFHQKKGNTAEEVATLPKGNKLRIDFSGCEDSVNQTFFLTYAKEKNSAADLVFWAGRAADEISALHLKDREDIKTQLVKFLRSAKNLKETAGKDGSSVSICIDDSKPTLDGCSFEHLGLLSLAVSNKGPNVSLVIERSNNL
ncbi:MAG: hypothetical protein ACXVB9_09090 [Bdellovibrionota bacterium]